MRNDETSQASPSAGAERGRSGNISRRKLISSLGMAGVALVGGSLLGGPAEGSAQEGVVSSVSQLRNTPGEYDGQQVRLLGYYDGIPGKGGGLLIWDAAGTDEDNGGTVFAVSGMAAGRWKREYSTRLYLEWFGCKGLGTEDDSARVQAAVDALPSGGTIEAGSGKIRIETTIKVEGVPILFQGAGVTDIEGHSTQFIVATGDADGFLFSGVHGGGITGLQVRGEGLIGGSLIATERRGKTGNYMLSFYNARFKSGYNGITLRACNTVRFQNCVWNEFNGEQVILLNGVGDDSRADPVEFVQCGIAAGTKNTNTDNLVIDGLGGSIKFIAVAILYGRHGIWLRNTTGQKGTPKFLYFEGGGFENSMGVPVLLEAGAQVQFSNAYIGSDGEDDNVKIMSSFIGNAIFTGCVIRGCGRNGIDIASSRVTVTGCLIGNNGRTAHKAFARTISQIAGNGSGGIRVTTSAPHGWETDDRISIQGVSGAAEANGSWKITVVSPNRFDLQGSKFVNGYISGGTAWRHGAGIHIRKTASRVVIVGNAIGSLAEGVSRQDYGIVCEAADVLVCDNDLNGNAAGPYQLLGDETSQTRFLGNKGVEQIDGWLTAEIPGDVANGLYDLKNRFLYLDGQRIRIVKATCKLSSGTCDIRLDADGTSAGGSVLPVTSALQSVNMPSPFSIDGISSPKKLQVRVQNASSAKGLEVQFAYQIVS
ncbi:ubiquitin-activating E1 FCCH domain-containing protein [Paenibacillus hamazuiensis]|uniref:ubiquitin-activating E1 FCCH domain-containing protein n=1 Tax=Paenibacillus hamazuiensis TaxID=2936508 RepID=UPI00200F31D6|nr:ubiquitin-activating E1 FCCH domain-containing protein [Paenibacillus hamazuiensis]